MEKTEIIKKIEKSMNKPSLMVDKKGNIKAVIIKLEDSEKEEAVVLNDGKVDYYEFDNLSMDFQEWDENSRDEAAKETIAIEDILSFYSYEELFSLIKSIAFYQKKNIEEDEALAKASRNNFVELSIFVPKGKTR